MSKVKWAPLTLTFLLCVPSCSRPWTRDEILHAFSTKSDTALNYPNEGWYRISSSNLMDFGEYDEFYGFSRYLRTQYVVGKMKAITCVDGRVLNTGFEKFVRKVSKITDGSLEETYQCFDGDMYATWTVSDGAISPIYGCRVAHPKFCYDNEGFISPSAQKLRQLEFSVHLSEKSGPYLYYFQGYYISMDSNFVWFNSELDYRYDHHLNLNYASLKATDVGALQPAKTPLGLWQSYSMEVWATDPIEISVPPFEERIVDVDTILWSIV